MPRGKKGFKILNRFKFVGGKRPTTVATLAKKVNKIARNDKPEIKHIGNPIAMGVPINELAPLLNVTHLFRIPRGVGPQNRVGNKIKATKIAWRGILRNVDEAVQGFCTAVRMVIVYDKRTNNRQMTLDEYNDIAFSGRFLDMASLRNEEFKKRFTVISDKRMILGGKTSTAGHNDTDYHTQRLISGSKSFKTPLQIIYDNATANGLPADTIQGSFYLLLLAETAAAGGPSLDLDLRLYFSDA